MKKIIFDWLLSLLVFSCAVSTSAQTLSSEESPKYEIRAVWLTTIGGIDWPRSHSKNAQKAELCDMLDRLKEAGINTVFL